MRVLPRHPVLRTVAMLWLLAAAILLLVTLLRPEIQANERAALSSLVPLYFLSLPLGHLGVLALGRFKVDLYVSSQYVPGLLAEGVALWALLLVLGYVQWFVLVPWLAGQCRRLAGLVSRRYLAR